MAETNEPRPDHGEMRVQVDGEEGLVAAAIRQAAGNIDGAPGQYWMRIVARYENPPGNAHELIRMWGVDLLERTLVTREIEDEVETARRQRPLTEEEIRTATDGS